MAVENKAALGANMTHVLVTFDATVNYDRKLSVGLALFPKKIKHAGALKHKGLSPLLKIRDQYCKKFMVVINYVEW